jgi:uncharacterized DUF497 family protein
MSVTVLFGLFEWDENKAMFNEKQHGVDFYFATLAFLDPQRLIATDERHSALEPRFYCVGKIGSRILTVRFTNRKQRIRIIGAGFWRKGRSLYEKKVQS